jgi:hypothetical protein
MVSGRCSTFTARHRFILALVALIVSFITAAVVLDLPMSTVEMWRSLPPSATGVALCGWRAWLFRRHPAANARTALATASANQATNQWVGDRSG